MVYSFKCCFRAHSPLLYKKNKNSRTSLHIETTINEQTALVSKSVETPPPPPPPHSSPPPPKKL